LGALQHFFMTWNKVHARGVKVADLKAALCSTLTAFAGITAYWHAPPAFPLIDLFF
jgi:hypothetical protein